MKRALFYFPSLSQSRNSVSDDMSYMTLSIDTYRFWFDALKQDDVEVVYKTLTSATTKETNKLLNGNFDFMENELNIPNTMGNCGFRKPISLCVIYSSFNILPILIEYGMGLEHCEINGDNILHLLVKRVLYKPYDEILVMDIYRLE